MKEFDTIKHYDFNFLVPKKCPHCGGIAFSTYQTMTSISSFNHEYYMVVFKKNCCEKNFICLYRKNKKTSSHQIDTYDLLGTIPKYIPTEDIPECIETIAPRFINLYKQSVGTLENGYHELATTGFRNSLELLVKEYAINFLGEDESSVSKLKLIGAINNYFKDLGTDKAAHYIRIIGNDSTHFEQKYEDANPYDLKMYIKLIANRISEQYIIKNPPKLIPRSSSLEK